MFEIVLRTEIKAIRRSPRDIMANFNIDIGKKNLYPPYLQLNLEHYEILFGTNESDSYGGTRPPKWNFRAEGCV